MQFRHTINMLGLMRTTLNLFAAIVRWLGSARVEICLILATITAIMAAAILQGMHGRSYSQWIVYHSTWFLGLLIMLSASLIAGMYVRWPWRRHLAGYILIHSGMLIASAGSLLNCWFGTEGSIVLDEGESTDQFAVSDQFQIVASWGDRPQEPPYLFQFESGPFDWSESTELDIGNVDGIRARVLNYYHHGRVTEKWVADDRRVGGPLVHFQLEGNGEGRIEYFLTDQDFGTEVFVGPIALRLQRAASEAMLADFLQPSTREPSGQGLLTMYYEDHVQQIAVEEHVGTSVEIGDSGIAVELVHYLPDARLDKNGKFQPQTDQPKNPLVELLVHVPNEDKPFRQVAFAKSPLLNLDGVYEHVCPVKFVYQHPKIKPTTAIEFMQDRDEKLYVRTTDGRHYKAEGTVTTGSRLNLPGGFAVAVSEYLPHARREISFRPAEANGADSETHEPAVEVEISVAGKTEKLWLGRNHLEFQRGTIATADGPLGVRFSNAQAPLGFSLRLIDCYGDPNRGDNSAASIVQLTDKNTDVDVQKQVTAAQPLVHNGLVLYQSSCRDAGHGKQASVLEVVYHPGRPLKSVGVWTIFLGIVTMLAIRSYGSIGLQHQWQLPGR
jgi:hypothetical protein